MNYDSLMVMYLWHQKPTIYITCKLTQQNTIMSKPLSVIISFVS